MSQKQTVRYATRDSGVDGRNLKKRKEAKMKVWIARDADGGLFMYSHKPKRESTFFMRNLKIEINGLWPLPETALPEVTWENSPQEFYIEINCYKLITKVKKGGVN